MSFGTTPKGSDSIPLSSAYVPGDGLYSIQGKLKTTDGSSNSSVIVVFAPYDSSTATLSNVGASTSSQTLFAANALRKGAILTNDSSSACYIKFGSTASSTSYTYKIPANGVWEMPHTPLYTGIVTIIWDSATGTGRGTELT